MAATLQAEVIQDLIATTLKELTEGTWTDMTSDIQDHVAANELMNKNKFKVASGTGIQFEAMVGHADSARFVGLNEVDQVAIVDAMKTLTIPFRHITCNMAIIEQTISMNMGKRRIVDYVAAKKCGAMVSWAEKFENAFWGKPVDSNDELTPFGVKYWIVATGAQATFGFNGGNPSGFSAGAANLDSTLYPRWRNGNATYVDINKSDMIPKLREALTKCNFKPAVKMPTNGTKGKGRGLYGGYAVISQFETQAEQQNDRLGPDVASMDGRALVRRIPVTWVPVLDSDTTYPLFGIDWNNFMTKYLAGWWQKQTGPFRSAVQHCTQETHWDTSLNWYCDNRRHQFVLTK